MGIACPKWAESRQNPPKSVTGGQWERFVPPATGLPLPLPLWDVQWAAGITSQHKAFLIIIIFNLCVILSESLGRKCSLSGCQTLPPSCVSVRFKTRINPNLKKLRLFQRSRAGTSPCGGLISSTQQESISPRTRKPPKSVGRASGHPSRAPSSRQNWDQRPKWCSSSLFAPQAPFRGRC